MWWPAWARRAADTMRQRPAAANVVMGALLGGVGDAVCQVAVERQAELDRRRFWSMVAFGGAYVGWACTRIYRLYPRVLRWALPAGALQRSPVVAAAGQTALDQLFHCPLVYLPSFYVATGVMQGRSAAGAVGELRERYGESVVAMWGFWVPFMFVNFRVVPPHLNVLAMQTANLVWTVVLDYIAHR